ncbi:AIPR family protein [Pseudarthrobacter sp. J1738]|uniref:AIPR family protein n=1 Tax=Pseudarthrobacter sp. J1738 TaxID=3420446 RepID=UPI003D278860
MAYANDLILVGDIFTAWHEDNYPNETVGSAFEIFSAELVMKHWDLSIPDVVQGIVGGGNDGGIDAVYTFLDKELVGIDHRALDRKNARNFEQPKLTLVLIQAKQKKGFEETAIDKVVSSCRAFLDLSKTTEDLSIHFNEDVVEQIDIFRRLLRNLAPQIPNVCIEFKFTTLGSTTNVYPQIMNKAEILKRDFASVVSGATGAVSLLGATELLELYRERPKTAFELTVEESSKSGDGLVVLASLADYFNFLTESDGHGDTEASADDPKLLSRIFEWNVRDYQGDVAVNREIHESLLSQTGAPFWWKNNGVTIVATRVNIVDRIVSVVDPQVVNGLQTSNTIFETLKRLPKDHFAFQQKVLIRILMTDDEDQRDQVIRATNRQTAVTDASLYATETIQRDIEQFLLSADWFYDRRKNFYKNSGKKVSRIIGILALAQSLMAAGLNRPDDARARPGSLIKKDEVYRSIFDAGIPLELYLWVIESQAAIDRELANQVEERAMRNNLRFHALNVATTLMSKRVVESLGSLKPVATRPNFPSDDIIGLAVTTAKSAFDDFVIESGLRGEAVAKGREFVGHLNAAALKAATQTPQLPESGPSAN